MPEEATTPDLRELTRRAFDAGNRHDLDALMTFFAPDAVVDMSDLALGTFEGVTAIRRFLEDWWGTWGDHLIEEEETVDLGHGVVYTHAREAGRLEGSDGYVEQHRGWVLVWANRMIERFTAYLDIGEARAAAQRLAEERG
jgi:ketosteroid isomerase-like protein